MIAIEQYTDLHGRNLFERWFDRLDDVTAFRINVAIEKVRQGNVAAKGVGAGVMELRLNFGPGFRVYFGRDGDKLVVLLCGGDKSTQISDIAQAHTLLAGIQVKKGTQMIPLTKSWDLTVQERIQRSQSFRRVFLEGCITHFLEGDIETAKSLLRKYINATVGFVKLGADLEKSPKTLMRMFSDSGNPQARNLFQIIAYLLKHEGIVLTVKAVALERPARRTRKPAAAFSKTKQRTAA